MPNRSIDRPSNVTAPAPTRITDLETLNLSAVAGVCSMLNRQEDLFCHRLLQTETGLIQEGLSHRYTMMTLLGLRRYEDTGKQTPIDLQRIFDRMAADTQWIDNIGDLGLLLWTCAAISPDKLGSLAATLEVKTALQRFEKIHEGRTMELSWFLTGLAHAQLARADHAAGFQQIAAETAVILLKNQGDHGFFGHQAGTGITGALRGHIGSFADQVYPTYAFAKYGVAYGIASAKETARSCAEGICRVQGSMGQWWWHYNAKSGKVFEQYPVYSVHQHAMGPMALYAVQDAGLGDFERSIFKGLDWVAGNNELNRDFRDEKSQIIWRSIYQGRTLDRNLSRARSLMGLAHDDNPGSDFKITWECRPYELGWLLYAFAGRKRPA